MMKKFSISTQLLVLVFTLLLSTSIIFIIISYFSIQRVAEGQAVLRMYSLDSQIVIDPTTNDAKLPFDDMKLHYIDFDKDNTLYNEQLGYHISEKANDYISLEEFQEYFEHYLKKRVNFEFAKDDQKPPKNPEETNLLVDNQEPKENNQIPEKKYKGADFYKTKNGYTLYYVFSCNREFTKYSFIFTDDAFTSNLTRDVALRMFSTFLAILFISIMCIYVWSTRITRRLKNIQYHIMNLPKNKYEKEYIDDSDDEIGELSKSVEDMRKEIGHNEKTKQDMLQNISHDFKTPIAVIKSYAEALQDGMAGPEALDTIIEQAESLKNKVNRLLQYNSLEYLTKDKPFEEINMTELVNRVISNYKFQTKLDFNLDLEDNVIFMGYQENWSTVIGNIIDNAKRYAKTEIKITLRSNYLKIYNDGEHIDEQFLNSIFKPYEKGSNGQFGLGMSIVKKTVDFFGMNMIVRNEEGGGVSFIIKKDEVHE